MLSHTSKYAIRALVYLELYSSIDKKAGIKKIARELDIPSPFLGKILQMLVRHQLLASTKGPHGGFYLNKEAIDIPVMEIIEIIEGKDVFDMCVIRTAPCDNGIPCSMHQKMAPVRQEMKRIFKTETIADLVTEYREGNQQIML